MSDQWCGLSDVASSVFEDETVSLQDGGMLIMFTDGVTEALSPEGDEGDDITVTVTRFR
jgi:serine phosphatase RsbU (regulator of sigma subunit)